MKNDEIRLDMVPIDFDWEGTAAEIKEKQDAFLEIADLVCNDDAELAHAKLGALNDRYPDDHNCKFARAFIFVMDNDDRALPVLTELLEQYPDVLTGWLLMWQLQMTLGSFSGALAAAKHAHQHFPNAEYPIRCIATTYFVLKDIRNACPYLEKAADLPEAGLDLHLTLLRCYIDLKASVEVVERQARRILESDFLNPNGDHDRIMEYVHDILLTIEEMRDRGQSEY